MKTSHFNLPAILAAILLPLNGIAQVNSGSNGSDGALNPASNLVIDMADHPEGIYHYTSVNIPTGVTVSFLPNASNSPLIWLVQGNCTIVGTVSAVGSKSNGIVGALGGPGGFRGGNGSNQQGVNPADGLGPGGGSGSAVIYAGNGSFGSLGQQLVAQQAAPGSIYGNQFLVPLIGGSGGGGANSSLGGGGGGGGAILIVASGVITISGAIGTEGGNGYTTSGYYMSGGAGGSGGAIRLVATTITGQGQLRASGGSGLAGFNNGSVKNSAGNGRIRMDALQNGFSGSASGVSTQGFQPIIFPPANQAVSLAIQSVGGIAVAANPTGKLTTPDVIVPANQQNPVSIVVNCTNIPLNTEIIVDVKPAYGASVRGVAQNTTGTQASSTATVQVNMPRGGGIIEAKAVSGIVLTAANGVDNKVRSIAETGWTTDGERFAQVEVTAALGGKAQIAYLTESGKRYAFPTR